MEILEAVIENENTEEEIEQWTESHRAAVAIHDAPIEEIENRIVKLTREREKPMMLSKKKEEFRGD